MRNTKNIENEEKYRVFKEKEMDMLTSFISDLDPFSMSVDDFLSTMFRKIMELIPEADAGSVFVYENGKVRFVDALHYDINMLKKLRIDEKEFKLPRNRTLVVKNIMDYHSGETKKRFSDEIKPIKESLVFDLEVDGKNLAGMALDILEGNKKHFGKDSIRLMNLFKSFASKSLKMKILQKSLSQSNEELQLLLRSLPIAVVKVEKDFKFSYVNEQAEKLTGYSSKELLTMRFQKIIHPDFRELTTQRAIKRLKGAKAIDEYDVKIITKSGEEKWIDLRSERIVLSDHPMLLVSALDITQLKNAQKRIEELQKRYELALKYSQTSIFESNLKTRKIEITPEILLRIGYDEKEISTTLESLRKLIHPDDLERSKESLKDTISKNGDEYHVEYRIRTKSGNWVWLSEDGKIMEWDVNREPVKVLGLIKLIDKRKRMEEQLRRYATYDELTGAYNRRIAMTILEEKMKIAKRKKEPLSICFIDVNDLKLVNDTFGHQAGDDLLKTLTNTVKENTRESDVICRMGGDEFLIILPECSVENADSIWQKVKKTLDKMNSSDKKMYKIIVSHGCVQYDYQFSSDEFISEADKKMYLEKKKKTESVFK